ncbi:hypothetical protein Hypma_013645 [Hypsizygus marmoreus]|uniref:RING-type domain-containing protein n=1 Tax=Hypsizygus marmoreus TaxID=39966 RepID=A0A369JAS7_HYPMA|nr:hypothetical protein Hypma_013645 [Hypsizygus marmoreus]
MANVQCNICQDIFLFDQFRYFHCGHGFCMTCLEQTRKQRVCAICRHPKGSQEPFPIYINFIEPTVPEQPLSIVKGLDKIDIDSPAISLRRAARKIKEEAKLFDEGTARDLIDAAQRLEDRLLPLLSELEREKAEKAALLKKIDNLKVKSKEVDAKEAEIASLRSRLHDANEGCEKAISLAEEARDRAVNEMKENSRLRDVLQRLHRSIKQKDEEIQEAQASLDDYQKQKRLLKIKLHAITKQKKQHPKATGQDPDESLQIERPMEDVAVGSPRLSIQNLAHKKRRLVNQQSDG